MLAWKLDYKNGWHVAELAVNAALAERLHAVGEEMAERARELAPVRTGALRDSISYDRSDGRWIGGELVATVLYSGYVEYGTAHQAPHPFMTPAIMQFKALIGKRGILQLRGLESWMEAA